MFELIDNFKNDYPQFWSVWFGTGAVASTLLEILNTFGYMLPSLEGVVPPGVYAILSLIFGILMLVTRAIKQNIEPPPLP